MLATIKRSLVIAVIATAGVFASVGTAHAAPASRVSIHAVSMSHVHGITSAKNTNVVRRGRANFKFKPNSLKVPDCQNPSGNVTLSFTITNDSSASQQPEFGGSPVGGPLAPGDVGSYCANFGGVSGSAQITLASSATAVLTINVVK